LLYLSDTNLFSIGARIDVSREVTSQGITTITGSTMANRNVTVSDGPATLVSFNMPCYSFRNGVMVVSAPHMTSGTSYTLNSGTSIQTVVAADSIDRSICRMPWMDRDTERPKR
jgi:hypothetical protein